MTEQNKKFNEAFKELSLPVKIIFICLLPAIIVYNVILLFLSDEKRKSWGKHRLRVIAGMTVGMLVIAGISFGLFMTSTKTTPKENEQINIETNNAKSEDAKTEAVEETEKTEAVAKAEEEEEERKRVEEEAKKAEEEEKARLAEEERARKAAEEAEKQRQKEAILQEQMSRAPAAFADPLGHKGEVIAVTGSIIVDYAYRKNDTHKYTDRLPAGTKDGWGGFWIDTQYGKCYALYWGTGGGPKKEYHTGDTITFVGKVVSDESTFEPMNGIVAPLWIDATEDF
ncbi:hypothetical protein IKG68_00255 [Candidatus Saccharibacteria bacterium]|nr:hypothetical protein [Candidatus Saccharibacteria bacterium]